MGTCLKCPKSGQNKHVPKCPNRKDGSRCEGPLSRVAIRAMLVALRRVAAVGSSVARSLLIPHKVSSLRCGTLRGPRVCVVKMRRRSFTPRFASKTIRSLPHLHSAGDEGMTLVGIWRAFAPALASRGASGVPAERSFGGAKRATFGKCWSPLDYASAKLKPFSRGVFIKARFAPL